MNQFPIEILKDKTILIRIKKEIYSRKAIISTSYKFTEDCIIFIDEIDEKTLGVYFKKKNNGTSLDEISQLFCNELIDQQTRVDLEDEMKNIRERIIETAFPPINKKK